MEQINAIFLAVRSFRSGVYAFATSLILAMALASVAASAYAGETKVYGSHYAFDNNFNNSDIKVTFGSGSTPSMTVSYNFPSGNLYGYPAICRGWHYGFNPAGDTFFPRLVAAIKSLSSHLSFSTNGNHQTGDFAYDLFFRKDDAKSTPQLEVMVWGDNNSYPIGTLKASNAISAGGRSFDLWEGMNSSAGYYTYTFIPHGTAGNRNPLPAQGSLNLDLKLFLNWLQANRSGDGHYSNEMYLDVMEGGFEITGGMGSVMLSGSFNPTI